MRLRLPLLSEVLFFFFFSAQKLNFWSHFRHSSLSFSFFLSLLFCLEGWGSGAQTAYLFFLLEMTLSWSDEATFLTPRLKLLTVLHFFSVFLSFFLFEKTIFIVACTIDMERLSLALPASILVWLKSASPAEFGTAHSAYSCTTRGSTIAEREGEYTQSIDILRHIWQYQLHHD